MDLSGAGYPALERTGVEILRAEREVHSSTLLNGDGVPLLF